MSRTASAPKTNANAPQQELHKALTTGHGEDERWHMRKDGSRFWASGMVTPLLGNDGQVRGFVKVARDYTAQKQAEAEREQLICALDSERAQLETVLESISDAFYAVNKNFCFTYVNSQAEEWWNRQQHDLSSLSTTLTYIFCWRDGPACSVC